MKKEKNIERLERLVQKFPTQTINIFISNKLKKNKKMAMPHKDFEKFIDSVEKVNMVRLGDLYFAANSKEKGIECYTKYLDHHGDGNTFVQEVGIALLTESQEILEKISYNCILSINRDSDYNKIRNNETKILSFIKTVEQNNSGDTTKLRKALCFAAIRYCKNKDDFQSAKNFESIYNEQYGTSIVK